MPIDIKGNPISDEGVPAYLAGALHEAQQFYERIGKFKSLFEYGTISLSNGKTAIDSSESIYFASGDVSDPAKFTFLNPCPSGAERIAIYDFDATVNSTPVYADRIKSLSAPSDFIVSRLKIEEADLDFANSLINIIKDPRKKVRLLTACKGSGRALVPLIVKESQDISRKEQSIPKLEFDAFARKPIPGEIDTESFELWYEEYEKRLRRVPEKLRIDESGIVQNIIGVFYHDIAVRDRYDFELKVEKPDPDDLEANLKCARSFLRDRGASKQLDEAFDGGTASAGALALASLGYSADAVAKLINAAKSKDPAQIVLIAASMKSDPIKDLKSLMPPGGWAAAPRLADGSVSHWIEGMKPCECGINGGKHLKRDRSAGCTLPDWSPSGKGKGKGGKGKGGKGKNGGGGKHESNATEQHAPAAQETKVTALHGGDVQDGTIDAVLAEQLAKLYASENGGVQSVKIPERAQQSLIATGGCACGETDCAALTPTSAPEAAKTEATVKTEAVKPEAVKAEAAKPEAVKPEAVKAEAAKPETVKTEAAEPEAGAPTGPTAAPISIGLAIAIATVAMLIGILATVVAMSAPHVAAHPDVDVTSLGLRGALDANMSTTPDHVSLTSRLDPDPRATRVAAAARFALALSGLILVMLGIVGPASALDVFFRAPRQMSSMLAYIALIPIIVAAPRTFSVVNRRLGFMRSVAKSANHLSHAIPWLITATLALSSLAPFSPPVGSIPSEARPASACSTFDVTNAVGSGVIRDLALPLAGAPTMTIDDQVISFPNASLITLKTAAQKQLEASAATGLPVICATNDSGASASSTDDCNRLVNVRACNEIFGGANGHLTRCSAIGDMPVIGKASSGELVRFSFSNVRCVPAFKYTLISVTQIWREQGIGSRFEDLNHLVMPASLGNITLPYDPSVTLPTLVLVSVPLLSAAPPKSKQTMPTSELAEALSSDNSSAALGFHAISSTAFIGRMSAEQAGELIHRRNHSGVGKTRALAHCTSDGTKNLARAQPACSCVFCAAARITRASHSGMLDPPSPSPGVLHTDIKGPFPTSIEGYKYAQFFVEEVTRFVIVAFLKNKSEAIKATQLAIAEFDAKAGTPVDDQGKALHARPRITEVRRDHEGKLESHEFNAFRAENSIHSTASPPHDHDLNGIAERIIRTIDEVATAMSQQAGAKIGFWPEIINHAVNWHNVMPCAVGSSTADPNVSPEQRLTLRQPRCMDLATIGSRAVILKSPQHQQKGTLSPRGHVGVYCGRSRKSIGAHRVWANGAFHEGASVLVDEEWLPWRGKDAHQPLSPSSRVAPAPPPAALAPARETGPVAADGPFAACNLFSGSYHRTNGMSDRLTQFGWLRVDQIDNDPDTGGGWDHDLLNDEKFTQLRQRCASGMYQGLIVAFPCSTFSVSRLFDAGGGDGGPPPIRDADHPDGLPLDKIPAAHHRELRMTNKLLDRTVELIITARHSPARTTIIAENPADRSIVGTNQYSRDLEMHGSLFATSAFKKLQAAIPDSSMCTFAQCRFNNSMGVGHPYQKYTTLWYTNDAAHVLDQLNEPSFQCNHPEGTHEKKAGGRGADGRWESKASAAYPDGLNVRIAMALTFARTGSAKPMSTRPPEMSKARAPVTEKGGPAAQVDPVAQTEDGRAEAAKQRDPPASPDAGAARRLAFTPAATADSPERLDFGTSDQAPPTPFSAGGTANAGYSPFVAGGSPRASEPDDDSAAMGGAGEPNVTVPAWQDRVKRDRGDKRVQFNISDEMQRDKTYSLLSSVWPSENQDPAAEHMEAFVADLAFEAYRGDDIVFDSVGPELVVPGSARHELLKSSRQVGTATWVVDDDSHIREQLLSLATDNSLESSLYSEMFEALRSEHHVFESCRADSAGAPENHKQAVKMGWVPAETTELNNHKSNGSWTKISRAQVPRGRRLHKLVWVYRLKRNGVMKARLCVQGCTMEKGIDFDQTFSETLRYGSARGLFAFAARRGCRVRSIDWVAAYLQGKFLDGEVVYCSMPPGHEEFDENGVPYCLRIDKPIYGMPQAGRRLQRQIFPWLEQQGGRRLDDSDGCVFVFDNLPNGEILALGVYVDNLQLVHSAKLKADGTPLDPNSFYAKFVERLQKDWDVEDEGEMVDLLGIEVKRNDDGSIKLHSEKFVTKLANRFFPNGVPSSLREQSTPYTLQIRERVIEALSLRSPDGPAYPELVKPCQERLGSLMYLCNSSRPDIVYAVHLLCRCMSCPTPGIISELDHIIAYLDRTRSLGLTYTKELSKLRGFSDASWELQHSTSGWVVFWQGAALTWGSSKQHCISLSSCEAEIVALSEATKELVYVRRFLSGIDSSHIDGPTELATDNMGARDTAYNPTAHNRMKHVARRHYFCRDMVESFEIVVPFVRTCDNWADFFTKPQPPKLFMAMRATIMNEPTPATGAARDA